MGRFQPGQSGNPAGKRKGTLNKTTRALETLLDKDAKRLTSKAVELALAGDMQALRLCMDRILPIRRDRPVSIDLPAIATAADAVRATGAITDAVSRGEITPTEASELVKVIDTYTRAIETHEFSERLAKLEQGRTNT